MIVEFHQWFETNDNWLREKLVGIELKQGSGRLAATTAYVESKTHLGCITIWETGALDAHVASRDNAESVYAERWDLKNAEEMRSVLRDFCEKLAREVF